MEKRMTRGGEVGMEGERKTHIDSGGRLLYIDTNWENKDTVINADTYIVWIFL